MMKGIFESLEKRQNPLGWCLRSIDVLTSPCLRSFECEEVGSKGCRDISNLTNFVLTRISLLHSVGHDI